MAGKALPDDLIPELLKLHGQGKSAESLCAWLLEHHQIEISAPAVRKRLAKVEAERRPITRAVIAEKLSRTVGKDLDEVGFAIQRALEDEINARADADLVRLIPNPNDPNGPTVGVRVHEPGSESWSRIMHVASKSRGDLHKFVELRLKLAGAETGNKKADSQKVTDDLMAKVDGLMKSAKVNVITKPEPQVLPPADGSRTLQ